MLRAQHHVFDPVGRRPAGRTAGTETDAPRHAAILDDLLRQGLQLFHGRRDLVAGILEVFRHVPDERLHVDLVGKCVEAFLAVLAVVGAVSDPAIAGAVVILDPLGILVAERRQVALAGEIGEKARLRQDGDVRRRARLCIDDDLLFVVFRRRIFGVDAGRFA